NQKRRSTGVTIIPEITAAQIKSVKLKKTENRVLGTNAVQDTSSRDGQPLVSLKDLQKISLRKTPASASKTSFEPTTNGCENRPEEVVDVRQFLKRTRLRRSPGGTPLPAEKKAETKISSTPVSFRSSKNVCVRFS
ncbi:hypothetical protein EGW08_013943, partial [Elysia chlorotica]